MLLDYAVRPQVTSEKLYQVTETLARWLLSECDSAALACWDREAWLAVEWVAYWHGVIPWLVDRIRGTDVHAPSDIEARLIRLDADNRERTRRTLNNAVELLTALSASGVEAIPLKGAVLAPLYYDDVLIRPMTDLDVLIHRQDLARGEAVLRDLGYRFYSRSAEDVVYVRGQWRQHGWSPDNVYPVELHYTLREEYAGLAYNLADVIWRSGARRSYWNGGQAIIPSHSALLHHVCAHATSDWLIRRGKLCQVNDIHQVVAHMNGPDWDAFAEDVAPSAARFVYPVLAFSVGYARTPVPEDVLHNLRAHVPLRLQAWAERVNIADASRTNHLSRSGIGLDIARKLSISAWERGGMLLRSFFPRRWNLSERYPRLIRTPLWPLCYLLLNADRLWHVLWQRFVRG